MALQNMNRKFYLLDRNIVSIIKDANKRKPQNRNDKVKMLSRLKTIDRKRSFVSPMLSIMEGQTGKIESPELIKATLEKESKIIAQFFRKAHIDTPFLSVNDHYISSKFHELTTNHTSYLHFLEKCSQLLYIPISPKNKNRIKDQILDLARENEIPFSSHIMMCPLSVLYGSDIARGVLKPKKNNFKGYNALNDLLFLSRIQQIKAHAKKIFQEEKFNIEFLSLDSNLLLFFSLIETLDTTKNIDRIETIVSYDRKLFPDLKKEDYLRLMEDIDSNF